jgi:hypothetical protein
MQFIENSQILWYLIFILHELFDLSIIYPNITEKSPAELLFNQKMRGKILPRRSIPEETKYYWDKTRRTSSVQPSEGSTVKKEAL